MNKYTPGPWRYVGFGGTHVLARNGRCIADAPQPNGMDPEEGFANARLIASAPELLEALEALLESAISANASLNWATGLNDEPASFNQARAAISKARGNP